MIVDVTHTQWAKFLNKVWPIMRDELINYVNKCGDFDCIRIYKNQLVDKETSNYFIRTHGFMSSIPGLVHLDFYKIYTGSTRNFPGFISGYINLKNGLLIAATDNCPNSNDPVIAFSCHIDPRQPKPVPEEL